MLTTAIPISKDVEISTLDRCTFSRCRLNLFAIWHQHLRFQRWEVGSKGALPIHFFRHYWRRFD